MKLTILFLCLFVVQLALCPVIYAQDKLPILGPPEDITDLASPSNWHHGFSEKGNKAIPENIANVIAETINGENKQIHFEVRPWDGIQDSLYISTWIISSNIFEYEDFEDVKSDVDELIARSPNADWEGSWTQEEEIYTRLINIDTTFPPTVHLMYGPNLLMSFQLTVLWLEIH